MTLGIDLFGDPVEPEPEPEPHPKTTLPPDADSYGRRLTARQHELAGQGINPLMGTTGPEGKTCGDCAHRYQRWGGGSRNYPKCAVGPATKSTNTDVRAYWPACARFTEEEA